MLTPHFQVEWDGWRIESVRPDHILAIGPEEGAPKGRKAAAMAEVWSACRADGSEGIIWQDPDIVADPEDLTELRLAVASAPDDVWIAPHKLWPASTGRDQWVWSQGRWQEPIPVMSQQLLLWPQWFALGFTYTPGRLLDLAAPEMPAWDYGMTDMGLSRIARDNAIGIRTAVMSQPKHLHFYPRLGDLGWRPGLS